MTDKPCSPYKLTTLPLKEVCFDVSEQDFRDFKFRFATHGSIDACLGSLFFHFMESVRKAKIPLASSEDVETSNNQRFNQMISQLTFPF